MSRIIGLVFPVADAAKDGIVYPCPYCDKEYKNEAALKAHCKKEHPDEAAK